ncbi:MAG: hypothetical protein QNK31_01925 [Porticoccus sp.]|nr:hypothetical protein [Porticoccus sp.]
MYGSCDGDGINDGDEVGTGLNPEEDDRDSDGVLDGFDNRLFISNAGQLDSDSDSVGDVCDNCLNSYNNNQVDTDVDGLGDVCDPCPGSDFFHQRIRLWC